MLEEIHIRWLPVTWRIFLTLPAILSNRTYLIYSTISARFALQHPALRFSSSARSGYNKVRFLWVLSPLSTWRFFSANGQTVNVIGSFDAVASQSNSKKNHLEENRL
jgi:hypothetical protein